MVTGEVRAEAGAEAEAGGEAAVQVGARVEAGVQLQRLLFLNVLNFHKCVSQSCSDTRKYTYYLQR